MNKNLLLLTAFVLCWGHVLSQDVNAYTVVTAGSVTFSPPFGSLKTEYPPWIIPGGWRSYFFTDGSKSYIASSPLDMVNNTIITPGAGPYLTTQEDGCTAENMFPWRRNYYGIVSAQYFNHPTAGTVSMGFVHGENLSMAGVNHMPVPCNGSDPWPTSYGAFVCGSWTPNNQSTNWGQQYFTDIGALVWPSMGYLLPSGEKCSLGCGSPSSIQADNGYMYVFYKDMSGYRVPGDPVFDVPAGRGGGIKVARAPMSDALNPQAYKSWYDDGTPGGQWNPSLPAGFTMSNTTAFFRTPGPIASELMNQPTHDYGRFSVAKVQGTDYYFGVGGYQDYDDEWWNAAQNQWWPRLKVSIRWSRDLVHWFDNRVVDVTNDWTTTHFDYPIFLSSDGWSNTSINLNDFYIEGTSPSTINHTVYKMHFYIPAPPPPPPPPPPPLCYDDQGRPMDCPSGCIDDPANGLFCPQSQKAKAMNGAAAVLDESNGTAPYVYPNPGHGVFTLNYMLKDHAITQLNVLDITGRKLQTGTTSMRGPGRYTETVNITGRAKGVYLLELLVNGGKKTFKVVYL